MPDVKKTTVKKTVVKKTAGLADFSKSHILAFKRYANRRDLLSALLEGSRRYTIEQVDDLLKRFETPKGKVK